MLHQASEVHPPPGPVDSTQTHRYDRKATENRCEGGEDTYRVWHAETDGVKFRSLHLKTHRSIKVLDRECHKSFRKCE